MEKTKLKKFFKHSALILIGSVFYGAGMGLFLSPMHLAPGGVNGIAVIINFLSGFPTGLGAFLINIPLLIIAVIKFGFKFFSSTLAATGLTSLMIDLFAKLKPATDDLLLASLAGGALCAIGLGLIFKAGATTGGTDIIVKCIQIKFPFLKTGRAFMITDFIIVAASGIISKDVNLSLYACIAMLVTSFLMDVILYGPDEAKLVYIISDNHKEISDILLKLDIGVTFLNGSGAFTGNNKNIIMCAMRKQLYPEVKRTVKELDKNAFMIVTSANEIFGEGFKQHDGTEL